MTPVGAYLRELRARRGVSLDEIARTTRVATRYLEALEADAYGDLPAPVFIRGFIRAYCQALGESPSDALGIYDGREGSLAPPPHPVATRTTGTEPRTRGAILVSFILLVVLGMALFTVALVIQPRGRDERPAPPSTAATPIEAPLTPSAPAPVPASPAAPAPRVATAPAPPATPVPAPTISRPPASAPAPATQPAEPAGARPTTLPGLDTLGASVSPPYRLIARISEPTWIRVRTDDGRIIEETVPGGETREWVSDRPFVLTIGNAGGVALELNGRALPSLGSRGVVIPRLVLPPEPR